MIRARGETMYNILVCDDEKDIVSALHIYLSSEGYAVVPAYSGKQALEIMQEQSIDLVLMDIMMPEMDGLTAVAKLREFSNVPVLFLTAKSEDADMILGLNMGADDYITKPLSPWRSLPVSAATCAAMPFWAVPKSSRTCLPWAASDWITRAKPSRWTATP